MSHSYIFAHTQAQPELERLQLLEQVFDPASQRRIGATGLTRGWYCLEVGAGAGSIMEWLATQVGADGKVVAVDRDTRFLESPQQTNIEILNADIRELDLGTDRFDLVHVRYVLIHIPDVQVALARILRLLKPGGWLVLEEPDFAAARAVVGNAANFQAFERVNRAIQKVFAQQNLNFALGATLPATLQSLDLNQLSIEAEAHLCPGGAGVARVMQLSTRQLQAKYQATGEVTEADLEQYDLAVTDPQTWLIHYATVAMTAQKPIYKT